MKLVAEERDDPAQQFSRAPQTPATGALVSGARSGARSVGIRGSRSPLRPDAPNHHRHPADPSTLGRRRSSALGRARGLGAGLGGAALRGWSLATALVVATAVGPGTAKRTEVRHRVCGHALVIV